METSRNVEETIRNNSNGFEVFVSCIKVQNKIIPVFSLIRVLGKKLTKRHQCIHCPEPKLSSHKGTDEKCHPTTS